MTDTTMNGRSTGQEPGFLHHFKPGSDDGRPPLLLLHGTGGDESDLLPLGEAIAPGRALLSPRGRVLENGMPRFFRRLAEGVFDEEDLVAQAHALAGFIADAQARYGLAKPPVAVGFSNGANIAAALLLLHPAALAGAVLIRAMPPLREPPQGESLAGKPVLLLSGRTDPIVSAAAAATLAAELEARGAAVTHRVLTAGHGLTNEDMLAARTFLAA